jgi:hypothetical protein
MSDYYTLLAQTIREAGSDPARLRGLVYEIARLALRRLLNLNFPAINLEDSKRLLSELEMAIERLETEAGGTVRRPSPAKDETASNFTSSKNDEPAKAAFREFDFRAAFDERSDDRSADRKIDEVPATEERTTGDRISFASQGDEETPATLAPFVDDQRASSARTGDDTHRARRARASSA